MSKKLLFVFNPNSGKGHIKNKLFDIINLFAKDNWSIEIYPTQQSQDAFEMVKNNGKNFDRIVAAGGDGTLNETICGIMNIEKEERPEIGYIPTGTVNDFASNMHIPKNSVLAAKRITDGSVFKCDIGSFNEKNFVYVAAFGAFTNVSYETPQQSKNILGQMAYFLEGIKQIHTLPSYKMSVSYNNEIIEDEFILGMVSNSNRIAGIKTKKAFKAQLNDGLFEVVLVKRPKNVIELRELASQLFVQDLNTEWIKMFRASSVTFKSDKNVQWTLDGEFGGAVANADICVKKEAISLII
jgi:YegS/Rv2252/BmrU family lipid kinase